jgi:hypothetical protein
MMCHQLITPNFRNRYFRTEIHALIKLTHIMVVGSVPRCSYNDFGNQLQWMQYHVCNDFTCLTDIKILTVTAFAINFKDIFNDCNMQYVSCNGSYSFQSNT